MEQEEKRALSGPPLGQTKQDGPTSRSPQAGRGHSSWRLPHSSCCLSRSLSYLPSLRTTRLLIYLSFHPEREADWGRSYFKSYFIGYSLNWHGRRKSSGSDCLSRKEINSATWDKSKRYFILWSRHKAKRKFSRFFAAFKSHKLDLYKALGDYIHIILK